jgi:hypothetical protein
MKVRSILLASALFSTAAVAHEGGHDVRGIVTAVTAQELTVKTKHGEEKFSLTPDTLFVKDGSAATAQDVKPADRVVVHAKKKAGAFEAFKVQFSAPKKQ